MGQKRLERYIRDKCYLWRDKEFAYYIKVSFIDNNGKMQSIGEELEAYRKMFELK